MSYHGSLGVGMRVRISAHPNCPIKILNMSIDPSGAVWLHFINGKMCTYKYSKVHGWYIIDDKGKRESNKHWSQARYALIEIPTGCEL